MSPRASRDRRRHDRQRPDGQVAHHGVSQRRGASTARPRSGRGSRCSPTPRRTWPDRARSRSATRAGRSTGGRRSPTRRVDVVDIVTPNFLHKEIAMAAIAAGKHVYCEKPLALNAAEAKEMYEAAEKAGVKTLVGFNYLRNPAIAEARRLIAERRAGGDLDVQRPVRAGRLQRPGCAVHLAVRAQAVRQRRARRPRRPHHLPRPGPGRPDQLGGRPRARPSSRPGPSPPEPSATAAAPT